MPEVGPDLCEEYLPYNEIDQGFVVCSRSLPCTKEHASTKEVANKFTQWGYKRGLAGVLAVLMLGISPQEIRAHIESVLEGGE